jgi:hypothetical protein
MSHPQLSGCGWRGPTFARGRAVAASGLAVGMLVPFVEVRTADRVAIVVPSAAITGVREQLVLVVVVADPVAAALGLVDLARLAAESARWLRGFWALLRLQLRSSHRVAFRIGRSLPSAIDAAVYF